MSRPRPFAPVLALSFLLLAAAAATAGIAPVDTASRGAPADTLLVDLPDLVVRGAEAAPVQLDRTRLAAPEIRRQDPASLADLGTLLPSARVAVNSRGDAHAMVRGAPERHVQTFLDGIPLNLPWDERVDLQTVPAVGVGAVEGRRGLVSLLDGPGALAGSVRLLPPRLERARATELRAAAGEHGVGRVEARHQRRLGDWTLLGAGAWRTRDHWTLPGGDQPRLGSDLRQWSALLRAARPLRDGGRLSLLATAWTAEKGVPPELHLGPGARFWRYPVRERLLLGGSASLPLGPRWDLGATLSADLHHQEIDARGPDRWGAPLVPGDSYEKSWDRTATGRLRLTRWLGERATVALQGQARYTHHRAIEEVAGPELTYAQWLTAVALESEAVPARNWTVRAGVGWDHAATPEAGQRAPSEPTDAVALNLRVVRELGRDAGLHAAASRRSRFPSLREAYSGALGRFVVNPDLGPERQDQVEVGGYLRGAGWRLEGAAFHGRLGDGIERVAIDDNRYQRVNRGRIDVPGLELLAGWEPREAIEVTVQHTVLDAHVEDGDTDRPAEDRPAYLSRAAVTHDPVTGPGALVEARVTGPRWSADGTRPDGLRRLPAGVTWHLRLSWSLRAAGRTVEAHVRVDNLFDQHVAYQTGLPGPGRELSAGVRARW